MNNRSRLWQLCCGVVFALTALAFSPLVLTPGHHTPELMGLPRTLWAEILIAFALVAMTFIGGIVHPDNESDDRDSRDDHC